MKIKTNGIYDRMFLKLSREQKMFTREMLELFAIDPFHTSLRNHPLDPPLERYRSISIDNDLRILFRMTDDATVLFIKI